MTGEDETNERHSKIKAIFSESSASNASLKQIIDTIIHAREQKNLKRPVSNIAIDLPKYTPQEPMTSEQALAFMKQFIGQTAKYEISFHPCNIAHQLIGQSPYVIEAAHILGDLMGGNRVCREVSPFATHIAEHIESMVKDYFELPQSYKVIPTLGGTEANSIAWLLARNMSLTHGQTEAQRKISLSQPLIGNNQPTIVNLIPNSRHYSFQRISQYLGLGSKLHEIEVDEQLRTNVDDLQKKITQIKQGELLASVTAICGTTETGSIDDLEQIATTVRRLAPHTWLHLDAAYGGPHIRTAKHKRLMQSLKEFDSITIDPHKQLFTPYNSGLLFIKNPQLLKYISTDAPYIGNSGVQDLSDKEFVENMFKHLGSVTLNGSGSTSGIYSAYATLQILGVNGLIEALDQSQKNTQYLAKQLHNTQVDAGIIEVYNPQPDTNVLAFRFIPAEFKYKLSQVDKNAFHKNTVSQSDREYINNFNAKIAEHYQTNESLFLVSKTKLEQAQLVAQRVVLINPGLTTKMLDEFVGDYIATARGIVPC